MSEVVFVAAEFSYTRSISNLSMVEECGKVMRPDGFETRMGSLWTSSLGAVNPQAGNQDDNETSDLESPGTMVRCINQGDG